MSKLFLFLAVILLVNTAKAQTADSYFDKGLEQIYDQKYNDAIMNFNKCIDLNKDNETAYYNRALCKYYLNDFKAAIKDYEKAIKIKKDYPNAYDNMGLAYEGEGNIDEAIKCYTISISIDNYNHSAYFYRGAAKYTKRDYAAAIEDFNSVLKMQPKNNDALIYKGLIKYSMRQYDEAIVYFSEAIVIKPSDGLAYYNRALCYLAKEDKTSACEDFGRAVENGYEKANVQYKYYCKPIGTVENNEKTKSLSSLFKQQKASVFLILTSSYDSQSQGSGFFITENGIAISNYHVFKGTNALNSIIYTDDGEKYNVSEVLEKNEDKDYIIFKIKNVTNRKFQPVAIAKSLPEIGEDVFAIGNPEGFSQTVSNGIISGYRENKRYLQTTTPITHGSSGGPIFNMKGEVIGITTMGIQEGSLFFSLSIKEINMTKFISK